MGKVGLYALTLIYILCFSQTGWALEADKLRSSLREGLTLSEVQKILGKKGLKIWDGTRHSYRLQNSDSGFIEHHTFSSPPPFDVVLQSLSDLELVVQRERKSAFPTAEQLSRMKAEDSLVETWAWAFSDRSLLLADFSRGKYEVARIDVLPVIERDKVAQGISVAGKYTVTTDCESSFLKGEYSSYEPKPECPKTRSERTMYTTKDGSCQGIGKLWVRCQGASAECLRERTLTLHPWVCKLAESMY